MAQLTEKPTVGASADGRLDFLIKNWKRRRIIIVSVVIIVLIVFGVLIYFWIQNPTSSFFLKLGDESFKLWSGIITLFITVGITLLISNRISTGWNLIQKKRETDINNIQQFYSIYGEFKEVSRLWRINKKNEPRGYYLGIPSQNRWDLLARACSIEGKVEAILVKLATERWLKEETLKDLGLFRQAIQQLRESIQDDLIVPSSGSGRNQLSNNHIEQNLTRLV